MKRQKKRRREIEVGNLEFQVKEKALRGNGEPFQCLDSATLETDRINWKTLLSTPIYLPSCLSKYLVSRVGKKELDKSLSSSWFIVTTLS